MGAAAVAKRLSFGGWHQHTDDQGVTVTYEEVLPNLTLSDGVPYLVAREPSGASLSVVALTDGTEASTVRGRTRADPHSRNLFSRFENSTFSSHKI